MNEAALAAQQPQQPPQPHRRGHRGHRTPPEQINKAERQQLVDELVQERIAMRERGEVPPLPDPLARRRGGRLQRIACGVELRQREVDGTLLDDEAEWLAVRREQLAEWQHVRSQRFAVRKTKEAKATANATHGAGEVVGTRGSPKSLRAVTGEQWRGQLKGPQDLRALVARVRGTDDTP
jgi:hypothetical protein